MREWEESFAPASHPNVGYIAGSYHTVDPVYGASERLTERLDKVKAGRLVPARRGGPWQYGGSFWERWGKGSYLGRMTGPYSAKDGYIRIAGIDGEWLGEEAGDEIRVPRGYDGECPRGCYWIDEDKE